MDRKRIVINEEQVNLISGKYPVDPRKVLLVKRYLDKSFRKGTIPYVNNKGVPDDMVVIEMLNSNGDTERTMTKEKLFLLLQSRFNDEKRLFADRDKCDRFLRFIIDKWMANDIGRDGMVKHSNLY